MVSSRQTLRNRLKLRQLALLPALDETGSLHKAADRMGMSQPSATRLLQDLEELIGAELFERTSKGMVTTPMGRLFVHHAITILAGIDQIHDEAQALRSGHAGTLHLGLFTGAPPLLAAQAIAAIKQTTPEIDVRLVAADNDKLLSDLQDGSLGMVIGRAPAAMASGTLNFELLYTDYFAVTCSIANTRVPPDACELPELMTMPWILPLPGTPLRNSLDIQFLGQCGRLPRNLTECGSIAAVQALLATGDYLAVMPRALAQPLARAGQIRILIDRLANIAGPVGIITRSNEARSTVISRMVQALHAAWHELHARDQDTGARA
jgi:DNA-binding transcriptional LysR family regulator